MNFFMCGWKIKTMVFVIAWKLMIVSFIGAVIWLVILVGLCVLFEGISLLYYMSFSWFFALVTCMYTRQILKNGALPSFWRCFLASSLYIPYFNIKTCSSKSIGMRMKHVKLTNDF